MTLTYKLSEEDYLQLQLYVASKDRDLKKKKLRAVFLTPLCLIVMGFFGVFSDGDRFRQYAFWSFAAIWLVFYPICNPVIRKWNYRKLIKANLKNRFGKAISLTRSQDDFILADDSGETKFYSSSLSEVIETGNYFYVKTKSDGYLVLPKSVINNPEEVKNELTELSRKLGIDYVQELNWKWK